MTEPTNGANDLSHLYKLKVKTSKFFNGQEISSFNIFDLVISIFVWIEVSGVNGGSYLGPKP